jgi:hypothetical protein
LEEIVPHIGETLQLDPHDAANGGVDLIVAKHEDHLAHEHCELRDVVISIKIHLGESIHFIREDVVT